MYKPKKTYKKPKKKQRPSPFANPEIKAKADKKSKATKANKTAKSKKDFLVCWENQLCILTPACRAGNIDRETVREWQRKDPIFAAQMLEIETVVKDFGESKLLQLIKNDVPSATIFFNKTRNRDRGYDETQQINNTQPIIIKIEGGTSPISNYHTTANPSPTNDNKQ
jgi:hypothetical protein